MGPKFFRVKCSVYYIINYVKGMLWEKNIHGTIECVWSKWCKNVTIG